MSLDCPLLKPACKRSIVLGNKPYQKPKCPLTDLVPKCPLTQPSKCPLIPEPCPLAPPKCPLSQPKCPTSNPSPCPLGPPKRPSNPPKCPSNPDPCPPSCPLSPPKCPLIPEPCPLAPPKCPLSPPKCPLIPEPCPLTSPPCPLSPPKCPLTPDPCPLAPPKCPFSPPKCPLNPPPTCPLSCPPPCPLSPPKCPLTPQPCPLAPPKCPLIPDSCPMLPPKCPLTVPPKSQCPLLPPKCPLTPPKCPLQPPPCPETSVFCPLDKLSDLNEPCLHNQYLNKSLARRPLRFPVPPPVCQEVARKCPFEPIPMICHELCPCADVPEVDAGPRCPFLPVEPVCPPVCPLERQPNCPLIQKPTCMWKPQIPTQCPLLPSSDSFQSSGECTLQNFDICPSFLNVPGKTKQREQKPRTLNIECCPFCDDQPVVYNVPPEPRSFHFPSCPMFEPPCQLESLPVDVPTCPFYPCPCPLAGCGDCPIKIPPLQIPLENECLTQSQNGFSPTLSVESLRTLSDNKFGCQPQERLSANPTNGPPCCRSSSTQPECPPTNGPPPCCRSSSTQPECPRQNFECSVPAPDCPLSSFKCPSPPPATPPLCPLKGCLKKPSCRTPGDCPIKSESCSLFPEGRCPKDDLKLCDCDYPVPPCMIDPAVPVQSPPSQYCIKDNCCMGLQDPPFTPAPIADDTYYSFMALNPGKESTKYFVDISDKPPDDLNSMSDAPMKKPLLPQCKIIKGGEGYKQCKSVKNILEKRGPCQDAVSQYDIKDCPMNEMTKRIKMSLQNCSK